MSLAPEQPRLAPVQPWGWPRARNIENLQEPLMFVKITVFCERSLSQRKTLGDRHTRGSNVFVDDF